MSLFAELKRRNVIKVALFYGIASWLLIQVTETLLPLFDVPESMLRGLVIMLALGLLPTIVFVWIYELTPDGIKKESEIDRNQSVTGNTGGKLNIAIVILLLLTLSLVGFQSFSGRNDLTRPADPTEANTDTSTAILAKPLADNQTNKSVAPPEKSIAVLPFVNMSSDVENEYFSYGLSEELLNLLVQIEALTVTSRTSSFSFKGQSLDIPTIAARLGVRYILEGSVRKSGNDIRVTAQLIQVEGDKHLWSDTFDRKLENIFALQDEIANEIAAALQIELDLLDRSADYPTENLQAYDEYLRGNHLFMARGRESLIASVEAFERATTLDPQFAEAWAARAQSAAILIAWDFDKAEEWAALARETAPRALVLDPNSGASYAALGITDVQMGEFETGLTHLRKAIELSPKAATPRFWLGLVYQILGYVEKARAEMGIAERFDPVYGTLQHWSAINSAMRGDLAQMEIHARRVLAGSSSESSGDMSYYYLAFGNRELAISLLKEYAKTQDEDDDNKVFVKAMAGIGSLDAAIDAATSQNNIRFLVYLGAQDQASELLQQWVDGGRNYLLTINLGIGLWTPGMKPVRKTPGFRATIVGLGLDSFWRKNGWPQLCRPLGEEDFECD